MLKKIMANDYAAAMDTAKQLVTNISSNLIRVSLLSMIMRVYFKQCALTDVKAA